MLLGRRASANPPVAAAAVIQNIPLNMPISYSSFFVVVGRVLFRLPTIRLRPDFMTLIDICLHALILLLTPLRALSCLLFSRADSVGHYDPGADALHRLLWCYSATTTVASFLIEDPNTGVLSTESSRRHGSGHTVEYVRGWTRLFNPV